MPPKKLPLLCLLLLLASCIKQPISSGPEDPLPAPCKSCSSAVLLDQRLFDSLVIADSMTSLVEFFSPFCPVCVSLEPMVDSLSVAYKDRALIGRVNINTDTVLWKRYAVLSVPTFLFFKDGALFPKRYQETPYDTLSRVLDSFLYNP